MAKDIRLKETIASIGGGQLTTIWSTIKFLESKKRERLEFCRIDKERWLTNLARFVAFLSENSVVPSFRAREITFSSEFGEKCD